MMIPLFPLVGKTLLAGRLISFAATLVIGATVGAVVWRKTRMAGVAALCGLMVFASNYIYHIGPLARLHLIMVMFELLAIVFIAESDDARHGTRNLVMGLILLTAAGWTKQLALATVLAAFLYLLIRNPKRAFISGAIFRGGQCRAVPGRQRRHAAASGTSTSSRPTSTPMILPRPGSCTGSGSACTGSSFCWRRRLSCTSRSSGDGRPIRSGSWSPCWTRRWPASGARANRTLRRRWWRRVCARDLQISNLKSQIAKLAPRSTLARSTGVGRIASRFLFLFQARAVLHMPTDGRIFGTLAQIVGVGRRASVYKNYSYYDSAGYTQLGHIPADYDHAAAPRIQDYVNRVARPGADRRSHLGHARRQGRGHQSNAIAEPLQERTVRSGQPGRDDQPAGLWCGGVARAVLSRSLCCEAIGQKYRTLAEVDMNGFTYHI